MLDVIIREYIKEYTRIYLLVALSLFFLLLVFALLIGG